MVVFAHGDGAAGGGEGVRAPIAPDMLADVVPPQRKSLPASLAKEPKGPAGGTPQRKVEWTVEDVTVLLKGLEEYGSTHLVGSFARILAVCVICADGVRYCGLSSCRTVVDDSDGLFSCVSWDSVSGQDEGQVAYSVQGPAEEAFHSLKLA